VEENYFLIIFVSQFDGKENGLVDRRIMKSRERNGGT